MDEHELRREIESYARALSQVADQHHRERTVDEIASLVSMPATPNRVRRSILAAVVLALVLAAGAIATISTVDRSSPPRRTPPAATAATNLARCQGHYPAITDTYGGMNAGIPGLDQHLVPIAAVKIRLCRYSFVTRGYPLIGSAVLTGEAATSFQAETNRLVAVPSDSAPTCPPPNEIYVATYKRGKQRVDIYQQGCGVVTNGTRFAQETSTWREEIAQYTALRSIPAPETCTRADLEARGDVPVPTPQVVTHHIDFHSGTFTQIDPPTSSQPAISATRAWQMTLQSASPRGTYEILLGNVSSLSVQNRLAWLIIGHHVPSVSSGGPARPPGVTRPPQPPCFFADLLEPVDATTGQTLGIEIGGDLDPR